MTPDDDLDALVRAEDEAERYWYVRRRDGLDG